MRRVWGSAPGGGEGCGTRGINKIVPLNLKTIQRIMMIVQWFVQCRAPDAYACRSKTYYIKAPTSFQAD
jgi:hypothetical protein